MRCRLACVARLLVIAAALFVGLMPPANSADVKRTKFGTWTKECLVAKGQEKRCHLAQTLVDKKGRKIVYFIVGRKKSGLYLEVSAPLGIYIPAGVSVHVDKNKGSDMELVDCNRAGCRAVMPLASNVVAQFKKGQTIVVDFVDSKSGKKLSVKGSLKGFSAAAESFGM